MPPSTRAEAGFTPSELASGRASLLREAILDSLLPPKSTDDREAQIPASYAQTFSWVFDHDLGTWLGRPEAELGHSAEAATGTHSAASASRSTPHAPRLFWISGLPGSGKSTLLRYIHQSSHLAPAISTWTDQSRPDIASFFFWESGTILQRSQEGFLRSLLAQLLGRRPSLIPFVFRPLWTQIWACDTAERVRTLGEWPLDRLVQGLSAYFEPGLARPPTLLLIDGLDELEGDPQVVLDLFARISWCDRVKICISSRPYSVFNAWFSGIASVRLQDLTGGDIEGFIRGRLMEHPKYAEMDQAEQDGLVRTAQDKAEGVFLWAAVAMDVLAVAADLTAQMSLLPSTLSALYRYRLIETSPDPTQLSRILQLMRARHEVAAFTRLNDSSVMTVREGTAALRDLTVEEVVQMTIEKADSAQTDKSCRRFSQTLHRSGQGLLQVQHGESELPDRLINYKHRTVKDWLADSAVWSDIQLMAPLIDAHAAHLRAMLILLKNPPSRPHRMRNVNGWWPQLVLCFTHARMAHPSSDDVYALLLELDSVMTWYWTSLDPDPRRDSWARSCFGSLESRGRNLIEAPFLALAARFGVVDFVRQYLADGMYSPGEGKSVLEQAAAFLVHRQSTIYPLSDPTLVQLLLDAGLDINHHAAQPEQRDGSDTKVKLSKTPWEHVLEAVQQADRRLWIEVETTEGRQNVSRWADIVRMCKEKGANMDVSVAYSYKDKKETAAGLLDRIAHKYPYDPLQRLA